jgi:hypothetical protein
MDLALEPRTREFYRHAMMVIREAEIPFLVGGAYAMERYTGIARHTKDFDIFVRPRDALSTLGSLARSGYRSELTHPHWLGKAYFEDAFVDVIFRSGNGILEVTDDWFAHGEPDEVFGAGVHLCPVEEMIWSKGYVMERERFDGADIAHLIRARAETLDWSRLVYCYASDWRVLLSHLVLFGYIYPAECGRIPDWVLRDLSGRLFAEAEGALDGEAVCQGTLLSRSQYLTDLEHWGYQDARLHARGHMSTEDVAHWTKGIGVDGQR